MAEGLFHATGKRKTAVARIWMKPGTGEITINKRPLAQYLNREADQNAVMEPLELVSLGRNLIFTLMSEVVESRVRPALFVTASVARLWMLILH
jgi:ribosomal protein S9